MYLIDILKIREQDSSRKRERKKLSLDEKEKGIGIVREIDIGINSPPLKDRNKGRGKRRLEREGGKNETRKRGR